MKYKTTIIHLSKRKLKMINKDERLNMIVMVTEIVAAYVSNNEMESMDVPNFINLVQRSLLSLDSKDTFQLRSSSEPAVSFEESIKPDYIVCLEDGRRLKMLKRHLKTAYNMTPDQYRERWNLPGNYPMVAPNYAKFRSSIAKNTGLGNRKRSSKKDAA